MTIDTLRAYSRSDCRSLAHGMREFESHLAHSHTYLCIDHQLLCHMNCSCVPQQCSKNCVVSLFDYLHDIQLELESVFQSHNGFRHLALRVALIDRCEQCASQRNVCYLTRAREARHTAAERYDTSIHKYASLNSSLPRGWSCK
jgi:hypothetical protein